MFAKPLSELIPEIKKGSDRLITICNILDVYDKPFDPDVIYDIFRNYYEIEELLQTKREKLFDSTFVLYSLNNKLWLPYPKTIAQFVFDCENVWGIALEFDKVLEINNFELK